MGGFYNYVPPSLGNRTWPSYRIPGQGYWPGQPMMPTPFPKDKESYRFGRLRRPLELVWAATPRCGCCICSAIASATAASRPWEGEKVWSRQALKTFWTSGGVMASCKFQGRRCTSACAQAIAEGLADHKGLRDLCLDNNGFGDVGTQAWS